MEAIAHSDYSLQAQQAFLDKYVSLNGEGNAKSLAKDILSSCAL